MAKCIRVGNMYKRHKYKNGVCVKCKAVQSAQLAELAIRRERRKFLRDEKRKLTKSAAA